LRYSIKISALLTYGIHRLTRSEKALHLLVWVYHKWRVFVTYVRGVHKTFFPELSSQNTASTLAFHQKIITRYVCWHFCHPQFLQILLGRPGITTHHLATKYDEEWLALVHSSFPTEARVKSKSWCYLKYSCYTKQERVITQQKKG